MTSPRRLAAALLVAVSFIATPLAAQTPAALPPASPPPTPPAQAVVAPIAPPANAVALCNDGSYVIAPAQPAACSTRGGLKVALPTAPSAQPPSAVAPKTPAAPARSALLRDEQPPAGATMRCRDGTWLNGAPSAARCDRNGGLAVILPTTQPRPPR